MAEKYPNLLFELHIELDDSFVVDSFEIDPSQMDTRPIDKSEIDLSGKLPYLTLNKRLYNNSRLQFQTYKVEQPR